MVSSQLFYAVTLSLVAMLIISGTVATYYYQQAVQLTSQNNAYQSELQNEVNSYNALTTKYNSLAKNVSLLISQINSQKMESSQLAMLYNQSQVYFTLLENNFLSLASKYNETIKLLTNLVSNINTTTSVYKDATSKLSSLWQDYLKILRNYTVTSSNLSLVMHQIAQKLETMNFSISVKPPPLIKPSIYTANIMVDFGNGTRIWYNNTQVQPGWNLYVLTIVITKGNMHSIWYPQYNAHFVTGLFGLENSGNNAWFIWTWNSTSRWQIAQYGADQLPVLNGSVYAWMYCAYNPTTFEPSCKP